MANSSSGKAGLRCIEPVSSILTDGLLCKRWDGRVYPPFIDPAMIRFMSDSWDTDAHDIFICSHQKVGTHLTKKFAVEILRRLFAYPPENSLGAGDIGHGTVPWPEVMVSQYGWEQFCAFREHTAGFPRLWYTHCGEADLPFRHIHPNTKFIFVLRDPKGAAVSQYFFYRSHPMLSAPPGFDLQTFLGLFLEGNLYFGDYHRHALDWISGCAGRIHSDQLLVLRYEDLVESKISVVESLTKFLVPDTILNTNDAESIAESTVFQTMKKDIKDNPRSFHFNPETFFRSGTTDDWKIHLSETAVHNIDEKSRFLWGNGRESCPDLSKSKTLNF
jgi:hypothetical protein